MNNEPQKSQLGYGDENIFLTEKEALTLVNTDMDVTVMFIKRLNAHIVWQQPHEEIWGKICDFINNIRNA